MFQPHGYYRARCSPHFSGKAPGLDRAPCFRRKHPGLDAAALTRRQREDLVKARALLRERRPALAVHLVYARVAAGRVHFDELDAA